MYNEYITQSSEERMMAANKSIFREKIERAFTNAGCNISGTKGKVFIDNHSSGAKRIKFSHTHLTVKQRLNVRHELRKEFTHHDFHLEDIKGGKMSPWVTYHGTAVTVFY